MDAMRVGGIASGLDTNSIIDSLMATAQIPIVRLNNEISDLTYEKTVYNDIIDQLNTLNDAMFDLKLESTFMSKLTTSTNESVLSATASTSTPTGSYTVNVTQTAKPAYASSTYLTKSLTAAGAGVTGLTSNVYAYDQVAGTHDVTISTNAAEDFWTATDVFTANKNESYMKNTAGAVSSTEGVMLDANGMTTADVDETTTMVFKVDGQSYQLNIDLKYEAGTMASAIAQDLEAKINIGLEKSFDTNGKQQIAVRTEYNETTGEYNFAFYDVASDKSVDIAGFVDINDPDNTSTVANSLGIMALSFPEKTNTMTNVITGTSAEDLGKKIKGLDDTTEMNAKGGLFPGATLSTADTGLTVGSFQVYQDSTVNARPATNSKYVGGSFSTITDTTTSEDITNWLKAPLNTDTGSLFDETVTSSVNGTFTINGKEITINEEMSPLEVMAQVNSSGAGVTMKYDYDKNIFVIENNTEGPTQITLGDFGDTSDILDVLNIAVYEGGVLELGQSSGAIDPTATLKEAGFSTAVTSGVFTINGVSIYVDHDVDSVEDIIDKVNNSGAGVTMAYDTIADKFMLTGEGTEKIILGDENDTSSFLQAAGLTYYANAPQEVGTAGTEAIFTVNGTQYTREDNEVSDIVPGMSFSIANTGTSVINVEVDTDIAVTAIAEMAMEYNKLIEMLTPTAPSDSDRDDYAEPLTDDEKASMSEDEIASYQQSYENILYYDTVSGSELRSLKTDIRSQIFQQVALPGTPYDSLVSLGLTTAGSDDGDINITKLGLLLTASSDLEELEEFIKEETTFVDKVANNSNEVFNFFAAQELDSDGEVEYEGWSRTMSTYLYDQTSITSTLSQKTKTSGTIDSNIARLEADIETQQLRAESYLELMWSRFAAMEQQVQYYNTQASYLTNLSSSTTA